MGKSAAPARERGPTIRLPYELAPSSEWRAGAYLVLDAVNDGPYMADVVFEAGQEGAGTMRMVFGLFPGLLTRVVIPLAYLDSQVVIPGRTPHRFKCVCWGGPLDPGRLSRARLGADMVDGEPRIRISEPVLADELPAQWPAAAAPIVDELHQWAGHDWPGKTRSMDGMRRSLEAELSRQAPDMPEGWSRWGGWTAKRFDATGFFRTQHDGTRWWLVDPDGCAFYSTGADCVRPTVDVLTEGNEDLFTELPAPGGPVGDLYSSRREGARGFDGLGHNLRRAFGDGWRGKWTELCRRRLIAWRCNTVGNWSDREFCRAARLPYVWPLAGFPATQKHVFRDFPDVFSEEYRRNARSFAAQLEDFRDDPCLIGYFLRNEPHWAFGVFNLPERMLLQPERLGSRDRLVGWLKEKYGEVSRLNAAWGAGFGAFGDLAAGVVPAQSMASAAAREDLAEFNRLMIAEYVRVPSEECRRVDAEHMNLGMRYAWIAHEDLLCGAEAFDVFSINGYQESPPADVIERCSRRLNKPVMVGEFHTGAIDRGLPWGGLRQVRTQAERADCYRYYVEQGAAIPYLVGAHYFQWNDQHVAGRFDGENWQIGLVDICQHPYEEMARAARASHERIYAVASGQAEPFDRLPPKLEIRSA
jgi:hypothetical protein